MPFCKKIIPLKLYIILHKELVIAENVYYTNIIVHDISKYIGTLDIIP